MSSIKFSQLQPLANPPGDSIFPIVSSGTNYKITFDTIKNSIVPSWSSITGKPSFATVAFSGLWQDIANKPTIPTVPTSVSSFTNDAQYITQSNFTWNNISGKPALPALATSGNWSDIVNKPGWLSSNTVGVLYNNNGTIGWTTANLSGVSTATVTTLISQALSGFTGGSATTSTLYAGTQQVSLNPSGTLVPSLLIPTAFTATCNQAHLTSNGITLSGNSWEYQVHFVVDQTGSVSTQLDAPSFPTNPGYVNGTSFTFTSVDHGIPNYLFTLTMTTVHNPGPMMYNANIAVSPPPAYPSIISSQGAVKFTANGHDAILGTDGSLTLPDGAINLLQNGTITAPGGIQIQASGDNGAALIWGDNLNQAGGPTRFAVIGSNSSGVGGWTIQTGNAGGPSAFNWGFQGDGITSVPGAINLLNASIDSSSTSLTTAIGVATVQTLDLKPAGGSTNQFLRIYPTAPSEGNHVHVSTGDLNTEFLMLGDDTTYARVGGGSIAVGVNGGEYSMGGKTWFFTSDGHFQLPNSGGYTSYLSQESGGLNLWVNGFNTTFNNDGTVVTPYSFNISEPGLSGFVSATYGDFGLGRGIVWTNPTGSGGGTFLSSSTIYASNTDQTLNIINHTDTGAYRWAFGADGTFNLPGATSGNAVIQSASPLVVNSADAIAIRAFGADRLNISYTDTTIQAQQSLNLRSAGGTYSWVMDLNGNLTIPRNILAQTGNDLNVQVFNPDVNSGVTFSVQNRQVDTGSKTTQFDVTPTSIVLTTNFTNNKHSWTFDNTGALTLQSSSALQPWGLLSFTRATSGVDGADIIGEGGVNLYAYTPGNPPAYTRARLATDGTFQFPGSLELSNGSFIADAADAGAVPGGIELTVNGNLTKFDTGGRVHIPNDLVIGYGGITFPDSTTQTTAYLGAGTGSNQQLGTRDNVQFNEVIINNGFTNFKLEASFNSFNILPNDLSNNAGLIVRYDSNSPTNSVSELRAAHFVRLNANNQQWSFNNDGSISFPNNTTQTTAWTGTEKLSQLADVYIASTPTDGQVLKWDGINGYWTPAPDLTSGGGGSVPAITVQVLSVGTSTLTWDSGLGILAYTPPNLSLYTTTATVKSIIASSLTNYTTMAVSDTPPATASTGSLWYESDVGKLKVYYSNTWVDASPASSGNSPTIGSGFVNAGVDVQLGNLKARIPTSGNRSLQLSTVSGTYSVYGSNVYTASGVGGVTILNSSAVTITTTPTYISTGLNFTGGGMIDTWMLMDTTAGLAWRISVIIGAGYVNNMISIERLV